MGVAGAALATAASELAAGACYIGLLLQRRLIALPQLFTPPKLASLIPLLQGGLAMLLRQAALNVAFISATRLAQRMDASGVSAAAYAITNQMYSLGLVVMLAVQATAATLIPAALAGGGAGASGGGGGGSSSSRADGSGGTAATSASSGTSTAAADESSSGGGQSGVGRNSGGQNGGVQSGGGANLVAARAVADRMIAWSTLVAASIAGLQVLALPWLTPLFSTLPEVQAAVRTPALVAAAVQSINGAGHRMPSPPHLTRFAISGQSPVGASPVMPAPPSPPTGLMAASYNAS